MTWPTVSPVAAPPVNSRLVHMKAIVRHAAASSGIQRQHRTRAAASARADETGFVEHLLRPAHHPPGDLEAPRKERFARTSPYRLVLSAVDLFKKRPVDFLAAYRCSHNDSPVFEFNPPPAVTPPARQAPRATRRVRAGRARRGSRT